MKARVWELQRAGWKVGGYPLPMPTLGSPGPWWPEITLGGLRAMFYFDLLLNSTEVFQCFNNLSFWSIPPKYYLTR